MVFAVHPLPFYQIVQPLIPLSILLSVKTDCVHSQQCRSFDGSIGLQNR